MTGASRGLGAAIVRHLAHAGWRVHGVARDEAALRALAAEFAADGATHTVTWTAADLCDPTALRALDSALSTADALVHAAAAFAPFRRCEATDTRAWDSVHTVGLAAAQRLTAAALPGMRRRGFGRLVYLGSLVGSLGGAGQSAYAAAKAGLGGLARSVAVEAGRDGVTANVLELGLFDTARTRAALSEATRAALLRATPAGRAGEPDEAAAVVGFLLSTAAAFVNGATLPLTGGLGLGLPRAALDSAEEPG